MPGFGPGTVEHDGRFATDFWYDPTHDRIGVFLYQAVKNGESTPSVSENDMFKHAIAAFIIALMVSGLLIAQAPATKLTGTVTAVTTDVVTIKDKEPDKGKLIAKPESEWVFTPVEPIVPEALWKQCNDLLQDREGKRPPGPKPTHPFAGILFCGCGQKMYVFSRSPKYVCPKCRNKIPIVDIEAIFREELERFFVSKEKVMDHLSRANEHLAEKKQRLTAHARQIEKVRAEMRKVYQLYQTDQVSPEGFGKLYRPLEDQERSLTTELPKLQGEVDALEMQQLSADEVVAEATNLHKLWPKFTDDEKRKIIESITEKIVVSGDEINITLCYMPSSEELTKRQRNLSGSSPPPA